jgi:hypothetical protein
MTKKFRGNDLEVLLDELEKKFPELKKELKQMIIRQKQRYSVNTLTEEYELIFSVSIKKQRKR